MFELETMLKTLGADTKDDVELPMTVGQAREIVSKFIAARQTLRRIVSLDEKNVPKFAKQIAESGLRLSN